MFTIDKAKAKDILTLELGYEPLAADFYLRDYPQLHDELKDAVTQWLETRTMAEINVGGVSAKEVMSSRGDHFLEVMRLFNRLLDEDVPTTQRERMAHNLLRPLIRW